MVAASKFKILRTVLGLRQLDLSLKTGLSTSKISLLERGLQKPSEKEVQTLAEAFGLNVEKGEQ